MYPFFFDLDIDLAWHGGHLPSKRLWISSPSSNTICRIFGRLRCESDLSCCDFGMSKRWADEPINRLPRKDKQFRLFLERRMKVGSNNHMWSLISNHRKYCRCLVGNEMSRRCGKRCFKSTGVRRCTIIPILDPYINHFQEEDHTDLCVTKGQLESKRLELLNDLWWLQHSIISRRQNLSQRNNQTNEPQN